MNLLNTILYALSDAVTGTLRPKASPSTRPTRKQTFAERQDTLLAAEVKRQRKANKRKGGV